MFEEDLKVDYMEEVGEGFGDDGMKGKVDDSEDVNSCGKLDGWGGGGD